MTTAPEMPLAVRDFHTPFPPREVMGYALILDPGLVDKHEDWSKVRSPGRARRREKLGHRQHIRRWTTPIMDVKAFTPGPRDQFPPQMFMHPHRWPSFALELAQSEDFLDRARRLNLDTKKALAVQKHWRWMTRDGRLVKNTLIQRRWLQISLDDGAGLNTAFARIGENVPQERARRVELLEAIPIHRGWREGWAVVWNNLIIDEVWL